MEARFMDTKFTTTRIVDAFTSFIWNDAYIGYGDFELRFPMEVGGLAGISEGYYVSIKESSRYMIVETIDIKTDVTDGNYAIISGRSLESLLDRRIVKSTQTFNENIETAILRLINSNIAASASDTRDIPIITIKQSTDPSIADISIQMEVEEGENLYDVIYSLCDYCRVGFRMVVYDDQTITFELYNGLDRSYNQTTNPYVVFSSKYENLKSSDMVISSQDYKNVAYVVAEWTERVTSTDSDGNEVTTEVPHRLEEEVTFEETMPSGMDRRELFVKSNSRPDKIDKAQFGKATDRVNVRDYMELIPVYFDREKYDEAMDAFYEAYNNRIDKRRTNRTETVIKVLQPGDPGYHDVPEGSTAEWVNVYYETIKLPDESLEDWRERNKSVLEWADKNYPKEEDYMKYGWVFKDEPAYNKAVSDAQADIDKEYSDALLSEEDRVRNEMRSAGLSELAKYSSLATFDGEVDHNVNFIYKKDYNLGDIVQIVNEYNFQATTRIIGVIFSEEEGTGFVLRPTFESDNGAYVY